MKLLGLLLAAFSAAAQITVTPGGAQVIAQSGTNVCSFSRQSSTSVGINCELGSLPLAYVLPLVKGQHSYNSYGSGLNLISAHFISNGSGLHYEIAIESEYKLGVFTGGPVSWSLITNAISDTTTSASTGTTPEKDTTGATLIILSITWDSALGSPTVSGAFSGVDDGNTYTGLTTHDGGILADRLYYCNNPIVGAHHTFKVTGTGIIPNIRMQAWSGNDTSSPLGAQQSGFNNSTVTTIQPGNIAADTSGDLIVTGVGDNQSGSRTIDSSFTVTDSVAPSSDFGGAMAYWVSNSTSNVNPTWTFGNSASFAGTSAATFKAASGGPTPVTRAVADTITFTDASAQLLAGLLSNSDTVTLSDASTQLLTGLLSFNDSLPFTDFLSESHRMAGLLSFSDTNTLSDTSQDALGSLFSVADSITVTDAEGHTLFSSFSLNDALALTDGTGFSNPWFTTLGDLVSLADQLGVGPGHNPADTCVFTDSVAITVGNLGTAKIPYHHLYRGMSGAVQ